ncbi:transposase [Agarilytica rhodophyticola]|uniref:transposase n=1 Tax=Agarilytica rhodophyticola TaxID=1737490 RepID=UPI000B346130|nr:transposase [Agarilytica rhodophyticola]
MPKPRKHLISIEATPYYHCVSRCVRRAFLCGFDRFSNRSYEHRRQWVEDQIHHLASVFAIDVCAYAVMSNHVHLVLHINKTKSDQWDDREVALRWHRLYKGCELARRYLKGEALTKEEYSTLENKFQIWRSQLCSISWFMRALNEPIARRANAEDECTGRFWEGRFKSQALLDTKALIACMAYVDLNPIRANVASTLDTSNHTSIKLRHKSLRGNNLQPENLMPLKECSRSTIFQPLPFYIKDYINLVDYTANIIIKDKQNVRLSFLPSILSQLSISSEKWLILSTEFEKRFKSFIGMKRKLQSTAKMLGFRRTPGVSVCKTLLG